MRSNTAYHERLRLENFTVFEDATVELCRGINVFVGENGSGKTHALKALYAWQLARHFADKGKAGKYDSFISDVYRIDGGSYLQRDTKQGAQLSGKYGESVWSLGIQGEITVDNGARPKTPRPVFIPSIELMGHTKNFLGVLRSYADFDRTCFDFVELITAEHVSTREDTSIPKVNQLGKLVPGEVLFRQDEGRFYLKTGGREIPFSLVAEGVRKVASLYRLVKFNWIIPGTTLYWDEPEVNINPQWMDEVMEALIALAAGGVQVLLATHSYVILKELELKLRERAIQGESLCEARYFLFGKGQHGTDVVCSNEFADLQPHPILDKYEEMLREDMDLQDREEEEQRPVGQMESGRQ